MAARREKWPFPGDNNLARARRVALAYRAALIEEAPGKANDIDTIFRRWGERWTSPSLIVWNDDDELTATAAAEVLCISPNAVGNLRRSGRLPGRHDGNRWLYRYRDLTQVTSEPRTRNGGGTVTVDDDGSSVP